MMECGTIHQERAVATPEQIAVIKLNKDVPVRKLAERTGLSKSTVYRLQTQVAEIRTDGTIVIINRRVPA